MNGVLIYRGDHRLRVQRIVWFHDGIRSVYNARGEFVEHKPLRRWECSMARGTIVRCGSSRSFTLAVLRAVWLVYRARFFPAPDRELHHQVLRRNLIQVHEWREAHRQ